MPGRDVALFFAYMLVAMSSASLPLASATLLAVKTSPPWLLALVASIAAFFAALFDHWLVRRAFRIQLLASLREQRHFARVERWAARAPFWTTALFAAVPVPFAIVRVLVPLSGTPRLRYASAVALGRFPRIFVIASFGLVVEIPWWILAAALGLGVVAVGATALVQRRRTTRRREEAHRET